MTRIIDYQMFSILLLDPTGTLLQHRFSLRFKENVQLKHEIPLGVGLVGYAAQHGQAVLVPDVSKDPRYIMANPETRSELCIPLIYKDKVIGVLDIEHTRRGYFNEDHVRIMTTHGGAGGDRHRERHPVRAHRAPGTAPGAGPGAGARTAVPLAAAESARVSQCRSRLALCSRRARSAATSTTS